MKSENEAYTGEQDWQHMHGLKCFHCNIVLF